MYMYSFDLEACIEEIIFYKIILWATLTVNWINLRSVEKYEWK